MTRSTIARRLIAGVLLFAACEPALADGAGVGSTLYDERGRALGTLTNPLVTSPSPNVPGPPTTPGTCTITPLYVTGTGGTLIPANPNRKSLRWMNVGGADITVAPGTAPPVAGQGMVYAATAAGKQGGSETFNDPAIATNAFAYAAATSAAIEVWECQ